MKTLMHICCAPCANQPIEVLRTDGIEVAGFWYNPNIHPVTERLEERSVGKEGHRLL
jgi:predicted adenine nucleotide alpha hydrolase (AANH) superfamily ATPase